MHRNQKAIFESITFLSHLSSTLSSFLSLIFIIYITYFILINNFIMIYYWYYCWSIIDIINVLDLLRENVKILIYGIRFVSLFLKCSHICCLFWVFIIRNMHILIFLIFPLNYNFMSRKWPLLFLIIFLP